MKRHGFVFVELLIAIAMSTLLAAIGVSLVLMMAHAAHRATDQFAATRTTTTLAVLLAHELGDAHASDITVGGTARLRFARAVGQALLCGDSAGALFLPVAAWSGTRAPEAGRDQAVLLADPASAAWQTLPVTAVDARVCPGTSLAAWRLATTSHAPGATVARITEPVELSAYRSGAADWLGLSPFPVTASVQPFAGPLAPGTARITLTDDALVVTLQLAGVPLSSLGIALAPGP